MAGRKKIILYHYNNSGKFLGIYTSKQELCDKYYEGKKYPLFSNIINSELHFLPDNTCVSKKHMHRDNVVRIVNRLNKPFLVDRYNKEKPIEVFNYDGVKIAEFYNVNICAKILKVSNSDIHSIMRASKKVLPKNKYGISIKYKD